MNGRITGLLLGCLFATSMGALSSCSSGSPQLAPEHPDLAGTWVINLKESDEPGDRVPREPPPGAPAGRRPGGGRGERGGLQPGTARLLQNSVAFKIEEGDSTLTLTGAEGLTRVFHPDGQERERRIPGLGTVTTRSRWKGDKLIVERTLEVGVKITEEFQLSDDARKLFVKMKIRGGPRSIEFRRVYDAEAERL